MDVTRYACGRTPRHILMYLWLFEIVLLFVVTPSYLHFEHSYSLISDNFRSDAFNTWRSVKLDPPDFLDMRNNTFRRHGDPIKFYFETGSFVTDLTYSFPVRKSSGLSVNCSRLVQFGIDENYKSKRLGEVYAFLDKKENVIDSGLADCSSFIKDMGYVTDSLTGMEKEFPIAYSILVFKDFVQVEMLLRAIYRPQNIYCIHVDSKADWTFNSKMENLAECFENVFLTKRSVDVTWGGFTVLEPEIICLEELWNKTRTWKYWINLTGQEFPLRTNYELVKILKAFDGANNVEGDRTLAVLHRMKKSGFPPYRLSPVKGAVHVVLARDFVDYVLHNKTSRDLLDWSRDVQHPDEVFFNTLNFSPRLQAPGSYRGKSQTTAVQNPFLARFKNWFDEWYCYGKQVRGICVFAMGDLPLLATREELFANKFHIDYSLETLYCLEELIYNRTVEEYLGLLDFNVSYYETRDFVRNKF